MDPLGQQDNKTGKKPTPKKDTKDKTLEDALKEEAEAEKKKSKKKKKVNIPVRRIKYTWKKTYLQCDPSQGTDKGSLRYWDSWRTQRWFDWIMHRLEEFVAGKGAKPAPLSSQYPNTSATKGGLSAKEVLDAAKKTLKKIKAELKAKGFISITIGDTVKRDGRKVKSQCVEKSEIVLWPPGAEGEYDMAYSMMHELFHKYGGVPEKYVEYKKKGDWTYTDSVRDYAEDILRQFTKGGPTNPPK